MYIDVSFLAGLDILRHVASVGAGHDSAERYPPPKCHPKTREDVLGMILDWINDGNRSCPVFWLFGPAGAGKSAIAQTIAERCSLDGRLGASFFFSRGKFGRDSGIHVFPTIAYQLAEAIPELRSHIDYAVQVNPSICSKSVEVQFRELILKPALSVPVETLRFRPIIIDGLDECDSQVIQQVLLAVVADGIHQHQFPIPVFISSRPEPHISEAFNRPLFHDVVRRVALDDKFETNAGIQIFLRDGFDDIFKRHRHLMPSVSKPWPSEGVIDLLVQKSSGQYIYASTILKYVDGSYPKPSMRLDTVLGHMPTSSSPFADLDQLYIQILSSQPEPVVVLRVLGCILVVTFPLAPVVIEEILGLEKGDVVSILSGLHSVVDIPHQENLENDEIPIALLHASFHDFLTDRTRSGTFFVDLTKAHTDVVLCGFFLIIHWHTYSSR